MKVRNKEGEVSPSLQPPRQRRSAPYACGVFRYPLSFDEKEGWVILDQMRTVDKIRLVKPLGKLEHTTIVAIKSFLSKMLVE